VLWFDCLELAHLLTALATLQQSRNHRVGYIKAQHDLWFPYDLQLAAQDMNGALCLAGSPMMTWEEADLRCRGKFNAFQRAG